jgi:hypothetical protein
VIAAWLRDHWSIENAVHEEDAANMPIEQHGNERTGGAASVFRASEAALFGDPGRWKMPLFTGQ